MLESEKDNKGFVSILKRFIQKKSSTSMMYLVLIEDTDYFNRINNNNNNNNIFIYIYIYILQNDH